MLQLSNFLVVLSDLFLVVLYVTLQTLYRDLAPALGRVEVPLSLFKFLKSLLNYETCRESTVCRLQIRLLRIRRRNFLDSDKRKGRNKLSRRALTEESFNRPLVNGKKLT